MSYLPRAKPEIKHQLNFRRNRIGRVCTEYYWLNNFFSFFFSGQSICVFLPIAVFTFCVHRSYAQVDVAFISFRLSSAYHRHCPDVVSRRKYMSFFVLLRRRVKFFGTFQQGIALSVRYDIVRTYIYTIFIWPYDVSNKAFVSHRTYIIGTAAEKGRTKGHLTQAPILRRLPTIKKYNFCLLLYLSNY